MNVFKTLFSDRKIFVAYITAGQGGLSYTEEAALALIEGGVDILEIGVPFSDPVADGPLIQNAMCEALNASVNITSVLKMIHNIKKQTKIPIVLFTYFNPLIAMGIDNIIHQASAVGVNGILVVDLPIEFSTVVFEKCRLNNIEPICLLSSSTDENRIKKISQYSNAFLYYVCRNDITGIKNSLPSNYAKKIKTIKSLTDKPIVSGFGIANKVLAKQALKKADGFVVGSAFVNAIANGAKPTDLKNLAIHIDPR